MTALSLNAEYFESQNNHRDGIKSPLKVRCFQDKDTNLLEDYFNRQSANHRRLRTYSTTQCVSPSFLTIYHRQNISAMILTGLGQVWGEGILASTHTAKTAEIALSIDERLFGLGYADVLILALVKRAKINGFESVYAETLAINQRFIRFCRRQEFSVSAHPEDATQVKLSLILNQSPQIPPEFPIQTSCLKGSAYL